MIHGIQLACRVLHEIYGRECVCASGLASTHQGQVSVLCFELQHNRDINEGAFSFTFNARSIKESSEEDATRRTDKNAAIRTSSSALDHKSRQV